jgi:hypothetical protein
VEKEKPLCSWQESKSVLLAHAVEQLDKEFWVFPRNVVNLPSTICVSGKALED